MLPLQSCADRHPHRSGSIPRLGFDAPKSHPGIRYARSRFFDPVPADLTTFFEEVQLGRQPIDHQQCRMLWNRPFAGTGRAVACQLKRFEVAQAAERPHMIFTFDVSVLGTEQATSGVGADGKLSHRAV